jgi:hypothetical protein
VEGEGIIFWVWPPERRVVEVCPSVPPWSSGWSIVVGSGGESGSRAGLSLISVPVLDNPPFVLPRLTLDGTKLEQFAKVHDLVLGIETAFEEEVIVDLEYGEERRRGGGGALNDRVDEFHLIRAETQRVLGS